VVVIVVALQRPHSIGHDDATNEPIDGSTHSAGSTISHAEVSDIVQNSNFVVLVDEVAVEAVVVVVVVVSDNATGLRSTPSTLILT
jgi:hypothetical protein